MSTLYKAAFGAVPRRAFTDERVRLKHLQTLGVVAGYDRMSEKGGGEGCFVARDRLASELSIGLSTLSDLLNDLIRWGYLRMGRHSQHRNIQTLAVCYSAGRDDECE